MDSLSQIVLGAATFALVKDKEIGKKALLYGAILGTIPDLDVLLNPFFSDIEQYSIHRAFSHSIFFAILFSLIFGYWFHKKYKTNFKGWFWASFLTLFTHPLLDLCTTYGTRILYPLSKEYYSLNNVFVVDPLYTIWLLIACIVLLLLKKENKFRRKIIITSLAISTLYLFWGLAFRTYIYNKFTHKLAVENVTFSKMTVAPTPFNTLYWQVIIKTEGGYYFSDYSLFDSKHKMELLFIKNDETIIKKIEANNELEPYVKFAQDYTYARIENGIEKVYVLKFGAFINQENLPELFFPLCKDEKDNYYIDKSITYDMNQAWASIWERIKGN